MDEKFNQILCSAAELFFRYGFRSVTMDDLSRELGISKKTLYVHFKDKNDMVRQVVQHELAHHQTRILSVSSQSLNAIEESFAIFKIVAEDLKELQPTVFYDLRKYYPEAWEVYNHFKNQFIFNNIHRNLEKGIQEGLYRDNINTRIIAINYANMINGVFDGELYPFKELEISTIHREIFEYNIRGIASKKGLTFLEDMFKSNHPS